MIFPCKVYNKDGKLKKTYTKEELSEIHWQDDNNPLFHSFSEGVHMAVKYAERKTAGRDDYIAQTDKLFTKSDAVRETNYSRINKICH